VVPAGAADALDVASAVLESGGIVVVPTDTVYGLGARPDVPDAVDAVYRAKGRPGGMHLPVLAAGEEQVRALGVSFGSAAAALATRWWPGPLTLIFGFEDGAARPDWLSAREEVAVRIPDHGFLRDLLARTGVLVVTSANAHGAPTPLTAPEAASSLRSSADLVVDGGELTEVPSTLVNLCGRDPVVEREGAIPAAEVRGALGGRDAPGGSS
jgi:L-threonylcarbamoyladenylate synthase